MSWYPKRRQFMRKKNFFVIIWRVKCKSYELDWFYYNCKTQFQGLQRLCLIKNISTHWVLVYSQKSVDFKQLAYLLHETLNNITAPKTIAEWSTKIVQPKLTAGELHNFGLRRLGRPFLRLTDWRFCCGVIAAFHLSSSVLKRSDTSSTLQVKGLVAKASPSSSDSSEETRLMWRDTNILSSFSSSFTTFSLFFSVSKLTELTDRNKLLRANNCF